MRTMAIGFLLACLLVAGCAAPRPVVSAESRAVPILRRAYQRRPAIQAPGAQWPAAGFGGYTRGADLGCRAESPRGDVQLSHRKPQAHLADRLARDRRRGRRGRRSDGLTVSNRRSAFRACRAPPRRASRAPDSPNGQPPPKRAHRLSAPFHVRQLRAPRHEARCDANNPVCG